MTKRKLAFQGKDISQLSDATKKRLSNVVDKAYRSGISLFKLKDMNDYDLRETFDSKAKSMDGIRRLIKQAIGNEERRLEFVKSNVNKYKDLGFKGKGLERVERDLHKTSSSTFLIISKKVQSVYGVGKRIADLHTKYILSFPKEKRYNLVQKDIDILDSFSP